ncbi:MAG: hypothetical protein ACRESS_08690 [Stenotrophobium sp.]
MEHPKKFTMAPSLIASRQIQHEFIARGFAARDEARRSGEYVNAKAVLKELDALLTAVTRGTKIKQ